MSPWYTVKSTGKDGLAESSPAGGGTGDFDCDILFISTPKTVFSAQEKTAVIEYVNEGGRLLFSMDDDVHSDLAQSEANDILAPFGLSFGALVPQTSGAFTYAGTAVTPTQRNITYLSGRVAAGGTPFVEINNTSVIRSTFARVRRSSRPDVSP